MDQLQRQADDVDHATLQHMLSLGGPAMRPALVAQLRDDLHRLRESLKQQETGRLKQTAHELKGLSATIGATALAQLSARFDELCEGLAPDARNAMALGLRIQIDRLDAILQTETTLPLQA